MALQKQMDPHTNEKDKADALAKIFNDNVGGGTLFSNNSAAKRLNLSTPSDAENELIKVAALKGPDAIFTVMRSPAGSGFSWFVTLSFRAIEVCLGPRPSSVPNVNSCDPYGFSLRMLELHAIDDIFHFMTEYSRVRVVQKIGLGIIELLIMDSVPWRHEVMRKGGGALVCNVGERFKDDPEMICNVVTVMAYLAAEDYAELILVQYKALDAVVRALKMFPWHADLQTRAALALLNLTQASHHSQEFRRLGGVPLLCAVMRKHRFDISLVIIFLGIVSNTSCSVDTRAVMVKEGIFATIKSSFGLDESNLVLQIACIKALVHYSTDPDYYLLMEEEGIPAIIGKLMVENGKDVTIQKYGNIFLGAHTYGIVPRCSIM
jgi:hypothetical protein